LTKVVSRLGLPVIWLTPSGLEITQSYVSFISKKLAIYLGPKRNTLTSKEKTNKTDKGKQKLCNYS
jgi:DNA-directed RNA polymerase